MTYKQSVHGLCTTHEITQFHRPILNGTFDRVLVVIKQLLQFDLTLVFMVNVINFFEFTGHCRLTEGIPYKQGHIWGGPECLDPPPP
jgi:hypothetical protein